MAQTDVGSRIAVGERSGHVREVASVLVEPIERPSHFGVKSATALGGR
jgi:hypothetical protein